MAARFVDLDRQTPMFLPCDLREWVPADHIVHFILDAVEQIPTGHFKVNDRGTGNPQYPPTLMLSLLIYCYATGRFGSRTIEAATWRCGICAPISIRIIPRSASFEWPMERPSGRRL